MSGNDRPILLVLIDDKPAQLAAFIGSIQREFSRARIVVVIVENQYEPTEFDTTAFTNVQERRIILTLEDAKRKDCDEIVVAEVLRVMDDIFETEVQSPDIISTDLGLPPEREVPTTGLKILTALRNKDKKWRLAVHSLLDARVITPRVLRRVVGAKASFIIVRDLVGTRDFAQSIDLVLRGFLIYSPTMANLIPWLIDAYDPLDSLEWRISELIYEGYSYAQIGAILSGIPKEVAERYRFDDSKEDDRKAREAANIPKPHYQASFVSSHVRQICKKLYPRYSNEDPDKHTDYDPNYHRRIVNEFFEKYGNYWDYEPWMPKTSPPSSK